MTNELQNQCIKLRPFRSFDAEKLAYFMDNKQIWNNLRDSVPFPYSLQNAQDFIKMCEQENPTQTFAIEWEGQLVGCIGLVSQTDVYRLTVELGYWIGEPFWGKGLASQAVKLAIEYAFKHLGVLRIFANVFEHNKASQKVLEKAGFKLEGIASKAIVKNNQVCDEYKYAIIQE